MRFKTDENLHPEVAALLRELGHDALTVWDQGLRGKSDSGIAEVCRFEKRALLTLDAGFADIRSYPPRDLPGLIVLRLKWQSRKHVLSVLPRLLALLRTEPLTGQLWIVDELRVRVRQG
jgi:predicted nuclease of predicted toxin-antitoxin system